MRPIAYYSKSVVFPKLLPNAHAQCHIMVFESTDTCIYINDENDCTMTTILSPLVLKHIMQSGR